MSVDVPAGSFLGGLEETDRVELERAGRRMHLPAGATILFEGDRSERVALILDGTARVFATAANGREVLVTVAGPGEILGEMSALDGRPHSASVTALDDVEAVLIPTATFRSIVLANARIATAVAARLTRELRRVVHQRVDLEAYDVPARLASVLVELHDRFARDDGPVELPVSQHELAEWCGASREAVTKALASFRGRGWVRTGRRSVIVLDVAALRTRAS
jgi:CRP/FNR family cyclic AMP-dependent transcriptional regulator